MKNRIQKTFSFFLSACLVFLTGCFGGSGVNLPEEMGEMKLNERITADAVGEFRLLEVRTTDHVRNSGAVSGNVSCVDDVEDTVMAVMKLEFTNTEDEAVSVKELASLSAVDADGKVLSREETNSAAADYDHNLHLFETLQPGQKVLLQLMATVSSDADQLELKMTAGDQVYSYPYRLYELDSVNEIIDPGETVQKEGFASVVMEEPFYSSREDWPDSLDPNITSPVQDIPAENLVKLAVPFEVTNLSGNELEGYTIVRTEVLYSNGDCYTSYNVFKKEDGTFSSVLQSETDTLYCLMLVPEEHQTDSFRLNVYLDDQEYWTEEMSAIAIE